MAHTDFVLITNPHTGQNATVTEKAFDTLYAGNGWQLVDKARVDMSDEMRTARKRGDRSAGVAGRARNAAEGVEAGQGEGEQPLVGSAAEIAARLNVGNEPDTEGGNASTIDTANADGRQSAGRNRGGVA